MYVFWSSQPLRRGVAAATALGLAALRPVFFLDADEAQAPAVLADDARTLDPFGKAAEELIKALPLAEFNPHVSAITPPQGVNLARGIHTGPSTTLRTTLYDRRHRARDPTVKDTVRTES